MVWFWHTQHYLYIFLSIYDTVCWSFVSSGAHLSFSHLSPLSPRHLCLSLSLDFSFSLGFFFSWFPVDWIKAHRFCAAQWCFYNCPDVIGQIGVSCNVVVSLWIWVLAQGCGGPHCPYIQEEMLSSFLPLFSPLFKHFHSLHIVHFSWLVPNISLGHTHNISIYYRSFQMCN